MHDFNMSRPCQVKFHEEIIRKVLAEVGNNCYIEPPFHANWGCNMHVGNRVWIGAGSVILPGVTIGDNSVIGAGSVVTKDIPSGVIAVGNPCRMLREINEHDYEYYYKNRKIGLQLNLQIVLRKSNV